MVGVAVAACLVDQLSKWVVLQFLDYKGQKEVIDGFFRIVHWGNTGAAWSLFRDHNGVLAVVSVAALVILYALRRHFEIHTRLGQLSLGLVFGGILGNLIDRVFRSHVIDFIHFYVDVRGGGERDFPAFNVADSAICTGVALMFLMAWKNDGSDSAPEPSRPT